MVGLLFLCSLRSTRSAFSAASGSSATSIKSVVTRKRLLDPSQDPEWRRKEKVFHCGSQSSHSSMSSTHGPPNFFPGMTHRKSSSSSTFSTTSTSSNTSLPSSSANYLASDPTSSLPFPAMSTLSTSRPLVSPTSQRPQPKTNDPSTQDFSFEDLFSFSETSDKPSTSSKSSMARYGQASSKQDQPRVRDWSKFSFSHYPPSEKRSTTAQQIYAEQARYHQQQRTVQRGFPPNVVGRQRDERERPALSESKQPFSKGSGRRWDR